MRTRLAARNFLRKGIEMKELFEIIEKTSFCEKIENFLFEESQSDWREEEIENFKRNKERLTQTFKIICESESINNWIKSNNKFLTISDLLKFFFKEAKVRKDGVFLESQKELCNFLIPTPTRKAIVREETFTVVIKEAGLANHENEKIRERAKRIIAIHNALLSYNLTIGLEKEVPEDIKKWLKNLIGSFSGNCSETRLFLIRLKKGKEEKEIEETLGQLLKYLEQQIKYINNKQIPILMNKKIVGTLEDIEEMEKVGIHFRDVSRRGAFKSKKYFDQITQIFKEKREIFNFLIPILKEKEKEERVGFKEEKERRIGRSLEKLEKIRKAFEQMNTKKHSLYPILVFSYQAAMEDLREIIKTLRELKRLSWKKEGRGLSSINLNRIRKDKREVMNPDVESFLSILEVRATESLKILNTGRLLVQLLTALNQIDKDLPLYFSSKKKYIQNPEKFGEEAKDFIKKRLEGQMSDKDKEIKRQGYQEFQKLLRGTIFDKESLIKISKKATLKKELPFAKKKRKKEKKSREIKIGGGIKLPPGM